MPIKGTTNDIPTGNSKSEKKKVKTVPPGDYCVHIVKLNEVDAEFFKSESGLKYKSGKKEGLTYDKLWFTLEVDGEKHPEFGRKWLNLDVFLTTELQGKNEKEKYEYFREVNGKFLHLINHSGYNKTLKEKDGVTEYPANLSDIQKLNKGFENWQGLPLIVHVKEEPKYNDPNTMVNRVTEVHPWHDANQYHGLVADSGSVVNDEDLPF